MILELDHVTKVYGAPGRAGDISVLKGVSLAVEEHDSLVIRGPSGSGKSTLLNIMGALDSPTGGAVRFLGRDLAGLSPDELAVIRNRQMGFVFQMHYLLPQCTVLENVLLPTLAGGRARTEKDDPAARAESLLERVGLLARKSHLPGQLSGGECQRVAVARALVNGPRILLADEPTGSLDAASAEQVGVLLADLNREQGMALVVVTHSQALAAKMSRRFDLADGTLRAG